MMGLWLGFAVIVLMFGLWYWEKVILPRRNTRPPVLKILELIKEGKVLVVNESPNAEERKLCGGLVDYVLIDPERKVKTYLYRHGYHGTAVISGDLDWMNKWEDEAVLKLIESISAERFRKYQAACEIEKAARDDKRRAEAKNIYESR